MHDIAITLYFFRTFVHYNNTTKTPHSTNSADPLLYSNVIYLYKVTLVEYHLVVHNLPHNAQLQYRFHRIANQIGIIKIFISPLCFQVVSCAIIVNYYVRIEIRLYVTLNCNMYKSLEHRTGGIDALKKF